MQSVEAAVQSIVAEYSRQTTALLAWCRSHPEVGPEELAARTVELHEQSERRVFAAAMEQASTYEPAPVCPSCEQRMHRLDERPRTVVTLRGDRTAAYRRYRCRHCGTLACPRYEAWQARHQLAPEAQEVALRLCCGLPYRETEKVLALYGVSLSDNTLQRLVREVGGQLTADQLDEVEAVSVLARTLGQQQRPERLYQQCDGLKVRIDGLWREVRLSLCYHTAALPLDDDGDPPPAQGRVLRGWLADCDTFCERFYAQSQTAGLLHAGEVVTLADGAAWIWERVPQFAPPGTPQVQILDFYHAAENLAKAVRAVHGEGTATTKQQFAALRRSLRAGDLPTVRHRLRAWQADLDEADEAFATVTNVLSYFQTHRDRMAYQSRKLSGYHIGSGQIESCCKHVGLRLKRPGADWSEEGITAVMALQGWFWSDDTADETLSRRAA